MRKINRRELVAGAGIMAAACGLGQIRRRVTASPEIPYLRVAYLGGVGEWHRRTGDGFFRDLKDLGIIGHYEWIQLDGGGRLQDLLGKSRADLFIGSLTHLDALPPVAHLFSTFPFGMESSTKLEWMLSPEGESASRDLSSLIPAFVLPFAVGEDQCGVLSRHGLPEDGDLRGMTVAVNGARGGWWRSLNAKTLDSPISSAIEGLVSGRTDSMDALAPSFLAHLARVNPARLRDGKLVFETSRAVKTAYTSHLFFSKNFWSGLTTASQQQMIQLQREALLANTASLANYESKALEFLSPLVTIRVLPIAVEARLMEKANLLREAMRFGAGRFGGSSLEHSKIVESYESFAVAHERARSLKNVGRTG